ncbi:TetR/AcrR family transcriptional regulator [Paenibacillus aquistagni]|uniref:TetR/AcrR family transcriptional regulator n=1 Tax=Paenibacillus aquistagni TaxID=1852522 RepID=UPI00145BC9C7|nr:TetR/AcrR family transcriptional regulator [Paenibacillus aquistagni]NMM53675.1 TetR/AcrR family transcriptional regulator [Paenibacillus aquistagni]
MRRDKEAVNQTIQQLLRIAQHHFTEYGYTGTALEAIAHEANLTRGALYHHFRSKKELFQVVFEAIHQEVAERILTESAHGRDEWEQLKLGCLAFLTAAVEAQNKRMMLIDGPSVLGWEAWRLTDESNSMRLLREQLLLMEQTGSLKPQLPIDAMVHMISGGLNELALWLALQHNLEESLKQCERVIATCLEAIKK